MAQQFGINSKIPGNILTGWTISPGQQYLIKYVYYTWTMNPREPLTDANGSNRPAASNYFLPTSQDPRSTEGCLVAFIGNPAKAKYYVGNFGFIGGVGLSGVVHLSINDAYSNPINQSFWNDNIGSINIEIQDYEEYLRNLVDPGEMEDFLERYGNIVGITTVAELEAAIANNSPSLYKAILNPHVILNSGEALP